MFLTNAKMTLAEISFAGFTYANHESIPSLIMEKRTGKLFNLRVVYSYGDAISSIAIQEYNTGGKYVPISEIHMKNFYFVLEMKKTGGLNTAVEPAFRGIKIGKVLIEWYDKNPDIPKDDTVWMVNPLGLVTDKIEFRTGRGNECYNPLTLNSIEMKKEYTFDTTGMNRVRAVYYDDAEVFNGKILL